MNFLAIVSPLGGVSISGNETQSYDSGDSVTLTCTAQGGSGNIVQWLRNGDMLPDETALTINLLSINASQGGVYTCNVSNIAGSGSASVTVNIRPRFTSVFVDLQQANGDSVTLTCEADSFPAPAYVWRRADGEQIRDGILTSSSLLVFDAVMFGDEGGYICNASSEGVTVQSEALTLTSEFVTTGQ